MGSSKNNSGDDWLATLASQSVSSDIIKKKPSRNASKRKRNHDNNQVDNGITPPTTKAQRIERREQKRLQREEKKKLAELKGETVSASWGNAIRSYVLDEGRVKDARTKHETRNPDRVLDGDIDDFIEAYLRDLSKS